VDPNAKAIQSLLEFAARPQEALEVAPDPVLVAIQQLEKTVKASKVDNSQVIAAIRELIPTLKAIPSAIKMPEAPEPTESVEVTNLKDLLTPLTDSLTGVKSAIEAQKLDPKVNVAAPNVKVAAPELGPLLTQLGNVEKAVKAIKFPTIPEPKPIDLSSVTEATNATTKAINDLTFPVASATPTDPFVRYLPADIDDVGTVQYFGFTDVQGHWYIQKFDTSTSPKTIRFTAGNSDYSTNFANRAGLTYTVWST